MGARLTKQKHSDKKQDILEQCYVHLNINVTNVTKVTNVEECKLFG